MYPFINEYSKPLRRLGCAAGRTLVAITLLLFVSLTPGVQSVDALSDAQQLVVDSWRLVNQGYFDPEQLDRVRWRRQRQKALEKTIVSSDDAYGAIETMLAVLDLSLIHI